MAPKQSPRMAWIDVKDRYPRKHGWYAVQDETVVDGWYMDAYWDGNGWWTFGMHVTLAVKKEITGVLRWRYFTEEEKAKILAEEPKAKVEAVKGSVFFRRLRLLYLIDKKPKTKLQLMEELQTSRRSLEHMFETITQSTGAVLTKRKNSTVKVASWGPLNKEWIKEHIKTIEENC